MSVGDVEEVGEIVFEVVNCKTSQASGTASCHCPE